jgi:hypothetical protein
MRGYSHILLGLAAGLAVEQLHPYLAACDPAVLALTAVDSATRTIRDATGTGARPD